MIPKTIPVIAIDGPGGSGKGTVSQLLAHKLGWHFLDSGVLYRALAFAAERLHVALDDKSKLAELAEDLPIVFKVNPLDLSSHVLFMEEDVTDKLREESYAMSASFIGVFPEVRQALLAKQRAYRKWPGLVADGRDMGSVVFPDACLKIFLDADARERARRRYNQLKRKGINVSLESVLQEFLDRDQRDRERTVAPLKPAPNAIIIDTTALTVAEVVQRIWQEKAKCVNA